MEAQREEEAKLAASRPPPPPEPEPVEATGHGGRSSRAAAKAGTSNGVKKKAPSRPIRERETDWELDCEVCGETGKNVVSTCF